MKEKARNDQRDGGNTRGRVTPRKSDEKLLDEYADRLDSTAATGEA